MLSPETIAAYRAMTPSQRLALTFAAIRENERYLLQGSPEVVARRFARIREQNDLFNRRVLKGLAEAEERDQQEQARIQP